MEQQENINRKLLLIGLIIAMLFAALDGTIVEYGNAAYR